MDQDLTVSSTSDDTPPLTQIEIDQRVFDLYDEYCHGRMDRRVFLAKSAAVTAGGLAMAQALLPRYARAQMISFTDPRIKARYVSYPSPGGTSGTMRGYLVQPAGNEPFPTVLVIHENRGLNPYIEDVARRAATEGFLALASDGLSPVGGYPGNDDGRALQPGLDQAKLRTDMLNSARYLKAHQLLTGKLGVTGFCWGGSATNYLAVTLGADMHAGVPFYGAAAETYKRVYEGVAFGSAACTEFLCSRNTKRQRERWGRSMSRGSLNPQCASRLGGQPESAGVSPQWAVGGQFHFHAGLTD